MTKKAEYDYITLTLPTDFYYSLVDIAEDELQVAADKWKVTLIESEKEEILGHANKQLVKKVEDITYSPFSLFNEEVKIRILDERASALDENGNRDDSVEYKHKKAVLHISKDYVDNKDFLDVNIVFNVTHGYSFVDIATRKTVTVSEFYQYFINSVEKWMRTAVFYGVASYVDQ